MKTDAYWKKRVLLLEDAEHRNAKKYASQISDIYDAATRDLEKELTKWYSRYANEEGISLSEAKRLLNSRDLEEFRMDVHEYIKKGRSLDPQWAKQLEGASVRVHISRLEALKVQTQQIAERLKGDVADSFDEFVIKTYTDQYYKTIFEIQKGAGIGFDVMKLDEKQLKKVINRPWAADGRNFSQRIWGDRTKLVNELHQTLSRGIVQGKAPAKMVKELSERMGVSKSATSRLIYTESAFFANQATVDSYKEMGVARYEVLATLDTRTSPLCRSMDGKVFDVAEREVGVNYPPFHVYCRTTTVPHFNDEFDIQEERAARDEEGKYYTVPADMKYPDWHKAFVEGGSKAGFELIDNAKKLSELISKVRAMGDNATEDDYKRVGKAFIKEFDVSNLDEYFKRLEDEVIKLAKKANEASANGITGNEYRVKYYNPWKIKNDELVKFNKHEIHKNRAEAVKAQISKYRKLGFDDEKRLKEHLSIKRLSPNQKYFLDAYQYYPTDWVQSSVDYGDLKIKKSDRGYYSHWRNEIAGSDKGLETAIHEFGHRFERTAGLKKYEKEFYDRRTQGEKLEWMGVGYGKDELTRKDKFLNLYIGKDYNEAAYEVCSMGFQWAYTNPLKLLDDEDFAQFIYGLLLAR